MTMDNLPIEILNNIFIYMDLFDRIKCTLVCHHWYHVLQEYSLFKNVAITDDEELLERFLHVMEESPRYAVQVEELCVNEAVDSGINKRTFVNTFPNARVIIVEWHGELIQLRFNGPYSEQIKVLYPTSKVKILHDSAHCELASQMLVTNQCSSLKELKLNFVDPSIVDNLAVLGQFKNLPALSTLTLENCMIGVYDLEIIHENAPNIRELKLDIIYIVGGEVPSLISSAHSVTSIHIDIYQAHLMKRNSQNLDVPGLHSGFYQYMSRKYLNLVDVKHHNGELLYSSPTHRRQVFLNGLLDFYRSILNPSTTKLNAQAVPNDINIFDVCDANDCQIAELEAHHCDKEGFFQHLIDSNQCNHILKLDLHDTEIDSLFNPIHLKTLQVLQLYYDRPLNSPAINLTDYLNVCPHSLMHFSITCTHLKADPSNTRLSAIKTLAICCRDPGQDICHAISSSFPYLVELEFTGIICIQKSITLELHSPTLK